MDQQLGPAVSGVAHRLDSCTVPEVRDDRAPPGANGDGIEAGLVATHEEKPAAVVGEPLRHSRPDPGGRAGDDRVAR
ncbi:hypothetical protein GCM10010464_51780 [Pseudonocardia yunnanensis]